DSATWLLQRLEGERDALPATDAQRDDATLEMIALHCVNEARGEHRAGRPDGMPVRDGTALDVDDVLRESEFASDRNDNRGERFFDPAAIDRAERPAGAIERLAHRWNRAEAEHSGLDRRDAIGNEARCRDEAALLRPFLVCHHHRGATAV